MKFFTRVSGKYIVVLLACLGSFFIQSCGSAEPEPVILGRADRFFKKEGLKKRPEVWEDGLRTSMKPGTFEWWYFDGHLDDGSSVVVTFFTKSMTNINTPRKPMVSIRIRDPQGKEYYHEKAIPGYKFSAAKESCDVRIGPNHIKGDLHSYSIKTETPDGKIKSDLRLKSETTAWRPGTGFFYLGKKEDKFFAWFPSVPHGTLNGSLTYGGKTVQVKGSGYHDHNWGNVEMSDIWHNWWWSRTRFGDYTNIAIELTTTKKYGHKRLPIFLLMHKDKVILEGRDKVVLERSKAPLHPVTGKKVETELRFKYSYFKDEAELSLTRGKDLVTYDMLLNLPGWKATAARLLGIRPFYHRFEGKAKLKLHLSLQNRKEELESDTMYELMYFGKNL